MVEFAMVLPIVVLLLLMIAEFGWFVAQSAASGSAAREAGRYASSVGEASPGVYRYMHCDGIRAAARGETSMVTTLPASRIQIRYLTNAGGTTTASCNSAESGSTGPVDSQIERFERVEITVSVPYDPITPLGPLFLPTDDLVSTDVRTIAKRP
jgi:TadE-like protein